MNKVERKREATFEEGTAAACILFFLSGFSVVYSSTGAHSPLLM